MIDSVLASGYDVIMVPSNSTLVGIADRAGYPVLTVPAGEGTGSAGRNPIGVTFVGTAGSEASLLAAGYSFEQGHSYDRRAPGVTNPSMWRCTPGGSFFTGELCNPGDEGEALAELVDGVGPGRSWAAIVTNIQIAKSDDCQAAACSLIDALVANVNGKVGQGRSGRYGRLYHHRGLPSRRRHRLRTPDEVVKTDAAWVRAEAAPGPRRLAAMTLR